MSEFVFYASSAVTLGGGGVPTFDSDSKETPRGGYAFFTGTFPEKDHPPSLTRNTEQSPRLEKPFHLGYRFYKTPFWTKLLT